MPEFSLQPRRCRARPSRSASLFLNDHNKVVIDNYERRHEAVQFVEKWAQVLRHQLADEAGRGSLDRLRMISTSQRSELERPNASSGHSVFSFLFTA